MAIGFVDTVVANEVNAVAAGASSPTECHTGRSRDFGSDEEVTGTWIEGDEEEPILASDDNRGVPNLPADKWLVGAGNVDVIRVVMAIGIVAVGPVKSAWVIGVA